MEPAWKTIDVIVQWNQALREVEQCRRKLNSAETDLLNAQVAVAKWLVPEDAAPGEAFHVWFGNGLLEVTKDAKGDAQVRWRKKPTPSEDNPLH